MSRELSSALADLAGLNDPPSPTRAEAQPSPDAAPLTVKATPRRRPAMPMASTPDPSVRRAGSAFPKAGARPVPASSSVPAPTRPRSSSPSTPSPRPTVPARSSASPSAPAGGTAPRFAFPSRGTGDASSTTGKPAGERLFGRRSTAVMEEDDERFAEDYAAMDAPMVAKAGPPPTPEQERVIVCEDRVIKVKAFAGAGKTSTLVGYAARRPRAKLLYIAFNRDIKTEASRKFGRNSNVKCMTSHGVAFGQFGVPLQDKFKIGLRWKFVYEATRIQAPSSSMARTYARLLVSTVANFVASAEPMIGRMHLPAADLLLLEKNATLNKGKSVVLPDPATMVTDAERLWSAMIDPTNTKIGVTHDAYLKLMQMAMPTLPYDGILLDEAQDSNPALLSLVQNQPCVQVLVGDPHQAIYGFRKAVDAMSKAKADTTLELTGSFRFGPEIADFANAMLAMKGEASSIRGLGERGSVSTLMGALNKGRSAFITRTNSLLFQEAATRAQTNQKVYFAGGIEGAGFDLLRDLHHLYYKELAQVKDPLLAAFASYEDFKTAVTENEEAEWTTRCKLIEALGRGLLPRLQAIERNCVTDINLADQVFSTAHKAKGLEFDHVILGEDFYKAQASQGKPDNFVKEDAVEETNALYVAATRAQKSLVITNKHWEFWREVSPLLDPSTPQVRRDQGVAGFPGPVRAHLEKVALLRSYEDERTRARSQAPDQEAPEGGRLQMASPSDLGMVLERTGLGGGGTTGRAADPFDDDPFDAPPRERKRL